MIWHLKNNQQQFDVLLDIVSLASWFGVGQSNARQALILTLPVTKAPWKGPEYDPGPKENI